jgi:two-component system, NarL family, sensor kinase
MLEPAVSLSSGGPEAMPAHAVWRDLVFLSQDLSRENRVERVIQLFLDTLPVILPVSFCGLTLQPRHRGEPWTAVGHQGGRPLSARLLDQLADWCRSTIAPELLPASRFASGLYHGVEVEQGQSPLQELRETPLFAIVIRTRRSIFGVLLVGKNDRTPFSAQEQLHLGLAANQFAYSLESVTCYTDTLHREREIALIYQTGQQVTKLLDLSELTPELVSAVSKTFGYESVTLLLVDPDTQELVVEATHGLRKERHMGFRIPITDAPEGGIVGWVAFHGQPLLVPDVSRGERYLKTVDETRSELGVPLKTKRGIIGVLDVQSTLVGGVTESDRFILETLADQVAIALENARLYKDLTNAHGELQQTTRQLQRLLERTVQIQEQERRRIAADIHDHISQLLYAALYEAEGGLYSLPTDPSAVEGTLNNIQISLNRALSEMRKAIFNLWPTSLDEMGLLASVQAYLHKFMKETGLECELTVEGDAPCFSPIARINIYRILQEALHNVRKHAQATQVEVSFCFGNERATFSVSDNGGGFAPEEWDGEAAQSLGLISMRERARSIGGHLSIQTGPLDGTQLVFDFPRDAIEEAGS